MPPSIADCRAAGPGRCAGPRARTRRGPRAGRARYTREAAWVGRGEAEARPASRPPPAAWSQRSVAPSDAPPTTRAVATMREQPELRRCAGGGGSAGAGTRWAAPGRARSSGGPGRGGTGPRRSGARRRSPTRSGPVDRHAVDVGAVRAAAVLDVPDAAAERQHRVLRGGERVVHDDGVVDVAAEGGDGVERERRARPPARPAARRGPPGARAPRGRARPPAGRARARAPRRTGTRRAGRGTARRRIQSARTKPSIVSAAAARRPARCRRPEGGRPRPSTISSTRMPFTRVPLVLPRSV